MTDTKGFKMALAEKETRLDSLRKQLAAAIAACKANSGDGNEDN